MRITILGIFLLGITSFYGQNSSKIDSLIQMSKYDEALQLASEKLETVGKQASPLVLGKAQSEIANIYFRKGNYDSTYFYAKKALALGIEHEIPEVIIAAYIPIGNIHYSKFEDHEAIATYQKIDAISQHSGIKNKNTIKAMFNLGEVLLRTYSVQDTSYISKAEAYFKKGVQLASEINEGYYENYGFILLGNIYGQRREYQKALPYFEKSLIYFENNSLIQETAQIYSSLGIVYTDLNNYDKANTYHKRRLKILIETGDPRNAAKAHRKYAGFLSRIGKYTEAIPHFEKAYDFYKNADEGESGILVGISKYLAISYQKAGNYEKAAEFYSKTLGYRDSLEARKQQNLALNLEAKYQSQQKEQEIKLLAAKNETIEAEKANQRTMFLAGIGVFLVAGVFLFFALRNHQKTNKKLKELDATKSRFFENISHEFRTPLSLIDGPIEEQLKKENLDAQERRNLTIAKNNAGRLLTLVDQILDLSKLASDHYNLNVRKSNLVQFLKAIVSSFEYKAETNNQEFISNIDLDDTNYWFDRDILEKVISNLLGNALKYTPEGDKISIIALVKHSKLQLEVNNTGVSLTQEELADIFKRFHRANENATGTGIGLALTKELVALHKGSITAQSDKNATSFIMMLPIEEKDYSKEEINYREQTGFSPAQEIMPGKIQNEEIALNNPNEDTDDPILLIVDDNAELREYLSSLFSEKFSIKTAKDGTEGLEKAFKYIPDVIITDLMMPNEDGLQLTKNTKTNQATSHIPILMLTSKAGDENKLEGIETGADAYITKPFSTEILKATVHNLLESRKKLQERFSQEVILIPKELSVSSYEEQFLCNLQEVMDTNLVESDFSAENFAVALGMSRMQLHRKLKAITGLSTTEFIRSQRLKLAVQLLKKSEINISQVGYEVGFNNPSYFTKCFKEKYGMSPSDFTKP